MLDCQRRHYLGCHERYVILMVLVLSVQPKSLAAQWRLFQQPWCSLAAELSSQEFNVLLLLQHLLSEPASPMPVLDFPNCWCLLTNLLMSSAATDIASQLEGTSVQQLLSAMSESLGCAAASIRLTSACNRLEELVYSLL